MEREYFECKCFGEEHVLRFTLDDATYEDREIYVSMFLNPDYRWWRRIWSALRYLFGKKCNYGHFDVWLMRDEDAKRLRTMLDEFIKSKEDKTT